MKMTRRKALTGFPLVSIVSLIVSNPAAAQRGIITGTVADLETAAPVADAAIQVLGREGATATTDASGEFRVSVAAGTHSIVVTRIGYETSRTDGISVEAGASVSVTIELRSRALALNQLVVTVSRREEKELDAPASISTIGPSLRDELLPPAADAPVTPMSCSYFDFYTVNHLWGEY